MAGEMEGKFRGRATWGPDTQATDQGTNYSIHRNQMISLRLISYYGYKTIAYRG